MLLVYRNTVMFYIFTLLNILIHCGIFFLNILGFFSTRAIMIHANKVLFLPFQSFSCLIEWVRISSIIKCFSSLNILLAIGFCRRPLSDLENYQLFLVFIMYKSWFAFLPISTPMAMFIYFLIFSLLICNYTDWFSNMKPTLLFWDKPYIF